MLVVWLYLEIGETVDERRLARIWCPYNTHLQDTLLFQGRLLWTGHNCKAESHFESPVNTSSVTRVNRVAAPSCPSFVLDSSVEPMFIWKPRATEDFTSSDPAIKCSSPRYSVSVELFVVAWYGCLSEVNGQDRHTEWSEAKLDSEGVDHLAWTVCKLMKKLSNTFYISSWLPDPLKLYFRIYLIKVSVCWLRLLWGGELQGCVALFRLCFRQSKIFVIPWTNLCVRLLHIVRILTLWEGLIKFLWSILLLKDRCSMGCQVIGENWSDSGPGVRIAALCNLLASEKYLALRWEKTWLGPANTKLHPMLQISRARGLLCASWMIALTHLYMHDDGYYTLQWIMLKIAWHSLNKALGHEHDLHYSRRVGSPKVLCQNGSSEQSASYQRRSHYQALYHPVRERALQGFVQSLILQIVPPCRYRVSAVMFVKVSPIIVSSIAWRRSAHLICRQYHADS